MIPTRAPVITVGQLYLNEPLNEYLIVTKNNRGQVHYSGKNFKGHSEDQSFVERFKPVDPIDVDHNELQELLKLAPPNTTARTGLVLDHAGFSHGD